MGSSSSSSPETTTTTTTITKESGLQAGDLSNSIALAGIEGSNITVTDSGAIQRAFDFGEKAGEAVFNATDELIKGAIEINNKSADSLLSATNATAQTVSSVAQNAISKVQESVQGDLQQVINKALVVGGVVVGLYFVYKVMKNDPAIS